MTRNLGADTRVTTLGNGVRVVAMRLPHVETASASVFVRAGSQHESARENGISHVVEHMAFKGTATRDCQTINLDAERLGADVNAHTDKDHTAFHMSGLARDAGSFVGMLADIVLNSTFPAGELERERDVILHEYAEDEDDALATAFKLFDKMCFGSHPLAQPVIGARRNIERFTRDELLGYVASRYSAPNVVVGIAGNIDPDALLRDADAAFGAMKDGAVNAVDPASYVGGVAARRQPGFSQTHVVLGFPIPALGSDDHASSVAAALFGEGMSSPLLDQIRERRGLAYYASSSADAMELGGQFVIEATTAPEHLDAYVVEVGRLLAQHADAIDPVGLARARNQIAVRLLRADERPLRRLENAAQNLFVHGRVRSRAELIERLDAVTAEDVRRAFETMLAAPPALAIAGKLGKLPVARYADLLAGALGRRASAAVAVPLAQAA
jgi:predicted Zn-dependent peptidase